MDMYDKLENSNEEEVRLHVSYNESYLISHEILSKFFDKKCRPTIATPKQHLPTIQSSRQQQQQQPQSQPQQQPQRQHHQVTTRV